MSILNDCIGSVPASPTLVISEKTSGLIKKGIQVINLSVGEPDTPIPHWIKQAAVDAIGNDDHLYTPVAGLPALKEAIIQKLLQENNLPFYAPDQIIVGCGAKQVIYNAFQVSLQPGQEVIIPAPYWVSYPAMVKLARGKALIVKTSEDTGFKLSAAALQDAITPHTRWFILNSPQNPTGAVYNAKELRALADVLLAHPHVWILSDDIYEHLSYTPFVSILSVEPRLRTRTLLVNGMSKSFSMTGWRIGYGAGPKELIDGMSKLQSHSTSGACCIAQRAALEALTSPRTKEFLKNNNQLFQNRRDIFIEGLPIPIFHIPDGAFYVYANVCSLMEKKGVSSDVELSNLLLEQAYVSSVPGTEFGLTGYIRLSYAADISLLRQALDNINRWVA